MNLSRQGTGTDLSTEAPLKEERGFGCPGDAFPMSLEYETQVYHAHLADILGVNDVNEGKYVVIKGDNIRGPFDSYEAALGDGYGRHGLESFLVKKIERNETIMYFARGLR
jgi:hypothetical protein